MLADIFKQYSISKKEIVYLILPLIFLLVLFPTVILPNQTIITGSSDTTLIINAELSVIQNPVSLWNNNWLTGIPEYANPLSDRFYPFFYPIMVLTQDPFIINLVVFIHLYIAYLCFFKLAGLMTQSPELRMITSLLFVFSGVLLSRVYAGHILIILALTWIPLLYYAFFKIVWENEATVKNICILAASLLLIFSTGAVYYLFYSCMILFVFFIYYLLKKQVTNGAVFAVVGGFILMALISAVKFIPVVLVSSALNRIDPINPLGDGGSLESIFSAIVFGTPIDTIFPFWESTIFIGMFLVILVTLGLAFDRERRAVPAFFAVVFSFIWAEGGRSLFSFVHLLPVLSNFRCAGRIFGPLAPILILFTICGFEVLKKHMLSGEPILLTPDQKRSVVYGAGILFLLKVIEIPFQTAVSIESALALSFIAVFIGLLYLDKLTVQNTTYVLIAAVLVNLAIISGYNITPVTPESAFKVAVVIVMLVAAIIYFNRDCLTKPSIKKITIWAFLLMGLAVVLLGNASYLQTADLHLTNSSAPAVIEKLVDSIPDGHQIWVSETGWFYKHLDFTYWYLKNGIHPTRAYYGYFMKTSVSPTITIGNIMYYTSDYIVDTQYLENGQQNIPNPTFKVDNISVYTPEHVLPNAFVVRKDQVVPSKLEKFSSDEVVISGTFLPGDTVVLKTAFYPGWKMNGFDTVNMVNMPGAEIQTYTNTVTFRYDPSDVKTGSVITGIGLFIMGTMIYKRREIDQYLKSISVVQELPFGPKSKKKK
jgi:hypothetical protein